MCGIDFFVCYKEGRINGPERRGDIHIRAIKKVTQKGRVRGECRFTRWFKAEARLADFAGDYTLCKSGVEISHDYGEVGRVAINHIG